MAKKSSFYVVESMPVAYGRILTAVLVLQKKTFLNVEITRKAPIMQFQGSPKHSTQKCTWQGRIPSSCNDNIRNSENPQKQHSISITNDHPWGPWGSPHQLAHCRGFHCFKKFQDLPVPCFLAIWCCVQTRWKWLSLPREPKLTMGPTRSDVQCHTEIPFHCTHYSLALSDFQHVSKNISQKVAKIDNNSI